MVCVRWSWQVNLIEINFMFDNKRGTKRFRFISEHSLTFAGAIQGFDGHKLLIPAISWGTLRPRQARSSARQKCDFRGNSERTFLNRWDADVKCNSPI